MRKRHKKRRIPKLLYSTNRGIGYYVTYRDGTADYPKKHRFGMVSREKALEAYNKWLAAHLTGETPETPKRTNRKLVEQIATAKPAPVKTAIVTGSLLHITSRPTHRTWLPSLYCGPWRRHLSVSKHLATCSQAWPQVLVPHT